jgi:hypothetical protein
MAEISGRNISQTTTEASTPDSLENRLFLYGAYVRHKVCENKDGHIKACKEKETLETAGLSGNRFGILFTQTLPCCSHYSPDSQAILIAMQKKIQKLVSGISMHLGRDRRALLAALGVWLFLETALIGIHLAKGAPFFKMTGDVVAVFQAPPWIGFYSQAGLLLWSAAASFCILAYTVLRSCSNCDFKSGFLLGTSCFTLLLLIDDTYLLHEEVLPHFGIPQTLILCAYMLITILYLCYFRKALISSNYLLLMVAGGGLGLSILSDATHLWIVDPHLFEDSFKLLGIAFWAAYCFSISRDAMTEAQAPSPHIQSRRV